MRKLRDLFAISALWMAGAAGFSMILEGQHETTVRMVMATKTERLVALALFLFGLAGVIVTAAQQWRERE